MDNREPKKIEIYEDCYCGKCEIQLTSENLTKYTQFPDEDYVLCDDCWEKYITNIKQRYSI
jgi:hypothetical protein